MEKRYYTLMINRLYTDENLYQACYDLGHVINRVLSDTRHMVVSENGGVRLSGDNRIAWLKAEAQLKNHVRKNYINIKHFLKAAYG